MADQESEFSPKDAQNLVMILRSLKEPLTVSCGESCESEIFELTLVQNAMVDIPAFAKMAGLTQGSAKNVLIKMRKKIDDTTVGPSNAEAKAKVKKDPPKKTPATKKRKVENMVETKEESNEEDE